MFFKAKRRDVVATFDGGTIATDGGALLLRQVEKLTGILAGFAACFTDHRDPDLIEHSVKQLIAQRVYALALGYEDLSDHYQLRHDPLLAVLAGKDDPAGNDRLRQRDKGKALAGKSTLNRLELTPVRATRKSRYKKVPINRAAVDEFFVDVFVHSYAQAPQQIILDLDATDDPIHGHQSGSFFHGYYDNYCCLPLYIFCGEHLLCARLRPSNTPSKNISTKPSKTKPKNISCMGLLNVYCKQRSIVDVSHSISIGYAIPKVSESIALDGKLNGLRGFTCRRISV